MRLRTLSPLGWTILVLILGFLAAALHLAVWH